jgi:hypothetical protein
MEGRWEKSAVGSDGMEINEKSWAEIEEITIIVG